MSAFHRVDDLAAMPARRLINFALRLPAYKGVFRALIESEANDKANGGGTPSPTPARPTTGASDVRQNRVVPSDANTLATDHAFAGLFEKKEG